MLSEYVTEELPGIPTDVHLRLGMPTQLKGRPPGWELERPYYLMPLQEADLVYRVDELVRAHRHTPSALHAIEQA